MPSTWHATLPVRAAVTGPFTVFLLGLAVVAAVPRGQAPAPPARQADDDPGILTPAAPREPRINGPSVYGDKPGRPFLYRVPATGDRPMRFSAQGLPAGLALDAATGIIRGTIADRTPRGYETTMVAANARGRAERALPHRRRRHARADPADGVERLVHVLRASERRADAPRGRHHDSVGPRGPRLPVREHRRLVDGKAGVGRSRPPGPGAGRRAA